MNIKRLSKKTKELTLLYVEDNESLKQVKLEMFNDLFKKVVHAKDGYEGLAKYQEEPIDLVITDINMPIMNGLEMVEKIQKIDESQAVIVLSAYLEEEHLSQLEKLNITSFMTKPVDTKKLFLEIENCTTQKVTV